MTGAGRKGDWSKNWLVLLPTIVKVEKRSLLYIREVIAIKAHFYQRLYATGESASNKGAYPLVTLSVL